MNINENEQSAESQNKRILAYLQKGNRLTQLEALYKFGCFRLTSRIADLRKICPDIKRDSITTDSGKRVAQYYIENI